MVTRFATEGESIQLALAYRRSIRECQKCPLHKDTTPVPWDGDLKPTFALMGEAPGAEEAEQGRPFVGRSGQKLRQMLRQVGIDDDKVTFFNSVQCRPPFNRDPEHSELAACKPIVTGTLEFVQPKVLITVGRVAFHQILGRQKPKLLNMHGKPLFVPHINIPWLATYHPSAAMRPGGKKYGEFILNDLDLAKKWTDEYTLNGQAWKPLEDCYICGDELHRFDEFGIGYCERHSKFQGNLFE